MAEIEREGRSRELLVVAYFLSRCGRDDPPPPLKKDRWHEAYDAFYEALHAGRDRSRFRNTLKSARDTFDGYNDTTRRGWVPQNPDDEPYAVRRAEFSRVIENWEERSDEELWSVVRAFANSSTAERLTLSEERRAANATVEDELARGKGQGFSSNAKLRQAVEQHAMARVRSHFEGQLHFAVTNRSKDHPYDFECVKDGRTIFVEVKGTTLNPQRVILTQGEVEFARAYPNDMVLAFVHSIEVEFHGDEITTSGGKLILIERWQIDEDRLRPITLTYSLTTDELSKSVGG